MVMTKSELLCGTSSTSFSNDVRPTTQRTSDTGRMQDLEGKGDINEGRENEASRIELQPLYEEPSTGICSLPV